MRRPAPELAEELGHAPSTRPPRSGARLLWEADTLLAVVPQLRATGFVANLARLRETLAAMLRDFQTRAGRVGIEPQRVAQASEILAALLDHVVTAMPWGADSGWRSLGSAPAPAGARPALPRAAQRLLEVARASHADRGMRELLGVALALGFDASRGEAESAQLNQLRTELVAHDARVAHELSPQWQSSVQRSSALTAWLPLWVSSLVVAALLAVLFFGLERSLAAQSDRLYARMAALNGPAVIAPQALPAPQPRLAGLLAEQVAAQSVSVHDEIDRSVVVVPGAQLFEAGGATLRPAGHELLRSIATALQHTPGRIEVIGHTDASFARSARYPSDWDLSVDRARTVEEALRGLGVEQSRLTYDGRAGIEPLLADRQSRVTGGDGRVEIVLLAGR